MKFYRFTLFTRFGDWTSPWKVYSPECFADDVMAWAANDCGFTAEFKRSEMYECSTCSTEFMTMSPLVAGDIVQCSNCHAKGL